MTADVWSCPRTNRGPTSNAAVGGRLANLALPTKTAKHTNERGQGKRRNMLTDLTISEARCDWLTVSARHNPELGGLMSIAALGLLNEQKRGERLRTWRSLGWETARAGHWLLATGKHGAYVAVGGDEAQTWGQALLGTADHCSRVDFCVTLQALNAFETPVPETIAHLNARYGDDKLASSINHYRGLKLDRGVSIGNRKSPYHARIYDKWQESGGLWPRGSWRWEVELKKHASEFEHAEYRHDPARFLQAGQIVATHFGRWGLEIPADVGPTVTMAIQRRKPPEAERALRWLEKQVRPTIQWLKSIGYGDRAYKVLFEQLAIPEVA